MKKGKRRIRLGACLLMIAFIALIAAELFYSAYSLKVSRYEVESPKLTAAMRIVFLSDLHEREFGKDNCRLLEMIEAEQPDVIALVGDFFNEKAKEREIERVCGFIGEAAKIAPVYFGLGNHEYFYVKRVDASLTERIAEAGAAVLEREYVDTEINGSRIRIGGYSGYYRTPHMNSADVEQQAADWRFFADFEDTESFKLLLDHVPTNWLDWEYRDKVPVDLVLSGHYHGGIIRIPFVDKGLYAPYVGWFPPYTKGMF